MVELYVYMDNLCLANGFHIYLYIGPRLNTVDRLVTYHINLLLSCMSETEQNGAMKYGLKKKH